MQRLTGQRQFVKRRNVGQREDRVEGAERDQRLTRPANEAGQARGPQQISQQPARRTHQQQRRGAERQQQVLDHVRREQVRVGERIQRRRQRDQDEQQSAVEGRLARRRHGAQLGAVSHALVVARASGIISTTGVGGLTLGGGV